MTQIAGKYGTGKSALLAELVRWFHLYGGGGFVAENESKLSVTLVNSILRWVDNAIAIKRTKSVEEWQALLLSLTKQIQAQLDGTPKEPGPGRIFPALFAVDSLVGKLSQESIDAIDAEGAGVRGHPVEALKISRFLKRFTSLIQDWPFHLVVVNQLDVRTGSTGALEKVLGGGKQPNFLSSIMLELKSEGHYRRVSERGLSVRISCMKNSLGEGQRSFPVTLKWAKEQDEWVDAEGHDRAGIRQQTHWDWDEASISLILSLQGMSADAKRFVTSTLDLHKCSKGQGDGVWSPRFGHRNEKDALTYRDAGILLAKDAAMMEELRQFFGIGRGYLFEPDKDYLEQVRAATRVSVAQEVARTERLLRGGDMGAGAAEAKDKFSAAAKGVKKKAKKASVKKAATKKTKSQTPDRAKEARRYQPFDD